MNVWVVMTNGTVNICIHVCVWTCVFLLGRWLGVEWLGHVVILYLTIWGTARWFSTVAEVVYFPSISVCSFQFLHSFYPPFSPFSSCKFSSLFFFSFDGPQGLQRASCLPNFLKYLLKCLCFGKILLIKKIYTNVFIGWGKHELWWAHGS